MSETTSTPKLQIGPFPEGWADEVFFRLGTKCVNCGSDDRVRVYPIIPLDNGGKPTPGNGTVLCKVCHAVNYKANPRGSGSRVFKLQTDSDQFEFLTFQGKKHGGVAEFLKKIIARWLEFPDQYDLLEDFPCENEVSVNTSLPLDLYKALQEKLAADYTTLPTEAAKRRGKRPTTLSVSAALRWLIRDYENFGSDTDVEEPASQKGATDGDE